MTYLLSLLYRSINMYRILIVEDDIQLCKTLKQGLEKHGYEVIIPDTLMDIENLYTKVNVDLTLLDVNLPYIDGFTLCGLFRLQSDKPIIFISSRAGEFEQIYGMELGADEYIVKPFGLQLLVAKIKSVMRRYDKQSMSSNQMHYNGLIVDLERFKLIYRDKEAVISRNELMLSKLFILEPNKIFERDSLLEALWDTDTFVHENTLNVNIKRLKNKLDEIECPYTIKSKRSVGYYLAARGDSLDED